MTKLVLYAQPVEAGPHISKQALKKGEYKEGGGSLAGLAFTDVGKAVWESLDKIFSDFDADLIESAMGPSPWAIRFTTTQFRLVLTRRSYKAFEGVLGSYLTLDFDGDKHALFRFIKTFLKNLRRPPWEMAFPQDFRAKTHKKMAEVAEEWEKFASGISLEKEDEVQEEPRDEEKPATEPEPDEKAVEPPPAPTLSLCARSFLSFDGESLVLNVKVENGSDISLDKVQVTPKASPEAVQFGTPTKMISYLRPGESLTLAFPLASPDAAAGEVWADVEGMAQGTRLTAVTEKRKMRSELPALEPAEVTSLDWQRTASALVRRDETRSKVYMAASEAFDEMLMRLKETGMFLLDPEVIHTGSNYLGHLKMYAQDAAKRPFAFALDCVGDYRESKITIHFYAESAELVMALREKVLAALAGKG